MKIRLFLLGVFIFLITTENNAQLSIGNTLVDTTTLATNLNKPWDIVYTQDSSIFFTERIGQIKRIDLATNQVHLLLDHTQVVESISESGMLGMAVVETTAIPRVFVAYTYRDSNSTLFERLSSFIYDMVNDTLISETVIIDSIPTYDLHAGSRLVIVNNQIYMSTGDATSSSFPQDITSKAGKILKTNYNGSVPLTNPIAGSYVYSWGHRNPQGLYFANNKLYSSEHGPSTDDEINIIQKGRNYGWPTVRGYCNTSTEVNFCNDSNVVEPIFAWTPTVATAGICYYDHPSIPEWQGSLLLTTLKASRLISLKLDSNNQDSVTSTSNYFVNQFGRLRDVETNQWGEVFIATNSSPNRIIRIKASTVSSIDEQAYEREAFHFWPNPASDQLKLTFKPNTFEHIQLFNLLGEEVYSKKIDGLKNLQINTSLIKQGVYIIRLSKQYGQEISHKLMIQNK